MKKLRYDLLLILGLLLAAAVMYLALRPSGQGGWAVVTVDGREVGRYPLSEDVTVTIGEADYNVLQITDGQATVIGQLRRPYLRPHRGGVPGGGDHRVPAPPADRGDPGRRRLRL